MSYTFVRVINNNAIVGADRKGGGSDSSGEGNRCPLYQAQALYRCVQSDRKGVRCGKKGQ